jgi:hypothetical protein
MNVGSRTSTSDFRGVLVEDVFTSYIGSTFAVGPSPFALNFGSDQWAETGSGYIDLLGGGAALSASIFIQGDLNAFGEYYGPSLALMHSYNYWLENQIKAGLYNIDSQPTSSFNTPGLPNGDYLTGGVRIAGPSPFIDPTLIGNYFKFAPTSTQPGSNAFGYVDSDIPFLLKRGDEIRVTYNLFNTSSALRSFAEQDFTVTEVGNLGDGSGTTSLVQFYSSSAVGSVNEEVKTNRIYNRIHVTPDPSTITLPIPNGEIYNFTVRRRVNADDRVIVYQTPPVNSFGKQTITPGGYLIPNDLTLIQKNNIKTIVNQLMSQNVVPQQSAQGNNNSSNTNTE